MNTSPLNFLNPPSSTWTEDEILSSRFPIKNILEELHRSIGSKPKNSNSIQTLSRRSLAHRARLSKPDAAPQLRGNVSADVSVEEQDSRQQDHSTADQGGHHQDDRSLHSPLIPGSRGRRQAGSGGRRGAHCVRRLVSSHSDPQGRIPHRHQNRRPRQAGEKNHHEVSDHSLVRHGSLASPLRRLLVQNRGHSIPLKPEPHQMKSGANTSVIVESSLIKTCSEGPAVSLNGSPTVSPTTAAL